MSTEASNKKRILIAAIALVAVIAIAVGVFFLTRPETNPNLKEITVTVVHKDRTEEVFNIRTEQEFLRGALDDEKLIAVDESGTFVTTVDGYKADDTAREWWNIKVNGADAMTGVNEIAINDGDQIKFILSVW